MSGCMWAGTVWTIPTPVCVTNEAGTWYVDERKSTI